MPDVQRMYDRMAPFYGPMMRLFPMWRCYTEAVLPWLPESGSLLEIGPGPGTLHQTLARRVPVAVALDLSPEMLRQTRKRLHRAGLTAKLVRGNALHLPFASRSFDGLVLTFAFSAFPDGPAAMQELARVLRPGGVVALVDACEPDSGNRIALLLARTWELFGDYMRDEAALMREAGLNVIERREFGAFDSIRITVGKKP